MLETLLRRYDRHVLAWPRMVLCSLMTILVLALLGLPNFRLDASADALLLEDDPALKQYRELGRRYGLSDFLFLTVTPTQDILGPAHRRALEALRDEMRVLPAVAEVVSILDVPLVDNRPGRLADAVKNYRTLEASDVDLGGARRELIASPIYRNFVISADGRTSAMRIRLHDDARFAALQRERGELLYRRATGILDPAARERLAEIEPDYQARKDVRDAATHAAIADLRAIIARHAGIGEIHLGGVPMIADDMIGYVRGDIVVFGIGALILVLAMLGWIFRELRWVVIPVAVCVYCTLFVLGLLGHLGWKLTVISSNFLALTVILGISINIHLIVRYRELYRERPGITHGELVRQTVHDMGSPCLYTYLYRYRLEFAHLRDGLATMYHCHANIARAGFYTTLVVCSGFSILVLSNFIPSVLFGILTTVAMSIAILAALTLMPKLLLWWKPFSVLASVSAPSVKPSSGP